VHDDEGKDDRRKPELAICLGEFMFMEVFTGEGNINKAGAKGLFIPVVVITGVVLELKLLCKVFV
jgi:hypothetical protein